jgi:hypothetical protein
MLGMYNAHRRVVHAEHPAPATSESVTDLVNIPGRSW